MEFTSRQFTGSESSGFIEVVVGIPRGTSNTPITVTVTPAEQSPVSAMGAYVMSISETKLFNEHTVHVVLLVGRIFGD